ncbi:hypothetical protein [Pantoea agglomerans]|uniref:hypothetical protein n=1 Tax=Enterobacter agglomerans TaxID=549 RepID=UPI0013BB6273|nr:hypothetical protein [Pantoea agglomerans]NEG58177.1 hypothetical protein [Pantoea agglomerans]NEG99890.1 hypothetical protein [Pantoea agglomerans]NEH04147.1 hypothetical protein [Pantoea agglomerans]NEH14450.1 hypothetical protein [Pantoea agglomerans]
MAANTHLKTTISFGAKVDGSFTGASGSLNKALKGIGTETARNTTLQTAWGRQLGRSLGNAAGETEKLTRAQESLKNSIREATLAGKDSGRLEKRYAAISAELEKATRRQNRLTDAMRREVLMAERAERAAQRRAAIGNGLRAGGRSLWRTGKGLGGGLMTAGRWASTGLVAGATAAVATPLMLNAKTAEELGQARGYGMSIEKYKAGGGLAAQFGLNAENFGDLSEEGTNKIWEEGNEKTLNPILKQLGLSKGVLQKMGRGKAFDLLMQKLSTMKDGAAAASLADQIMGAESNKFLTGLHTIGKTYNQAMAEANRYNLLTREGAEGAMQTNTAVNRLWGVAESGMQDTVGKITKELVPSIDDASGGVAKWIKEMQPKLTTAVTEWMKPDGNGQTGPQRLWDGVVKFGDGVALVASEVMAVAEKLSWLLPDQKKISQDQQQIIDYIGNGNPLEGARYLARERDLEDWFREQHFDDPSVRENLIRQHRQQPESSPPVDAGTDTVSPVVPLRVQPHQTNHTTVSITVNTAPGEDATSVGQRVYDEFRRSLPGGGESLSGNFAFDVPQL